MRRMPAGPLHAQRLSHIMQAPQTAATADPQNFHDPQRELDMLREQIREQAYREGLQRAVLEAEAEIQRRVDAVAAQLKAEQEALLAQMQVRLESLNALLAAVRDAARRQAADAEETAVEAAYTATLHLLGEKAAEHELMRELCRHALKAHGQDSITVRLSEADLESLDLQVSDVRFVADRHLRPGQCVIESPRGEFETGLDVRLDALKRAFLDGLAAHRSEAL